MASYLIGVSINIDCHRIGCRTVSRAVINLEIEARICRAGGIGRRRKPEAPAIEIGEADCFALRDARPIGCVVELIIFPPASIGLIRRRPSAPLKRAIYW